MPKRALLLCSLWIVIVWMRPLAFTAFSHDDREAIVDNPIVSAAAPWHEAFVRGYWQHRAPAGHWRPVASLSLRLDWALWGEHARGYHATNLALHLAVALLAAAVLRRLAPEGTRGWLVGVLLFALHPALADSVAWISGRTSMLAALGGLLGAWLLLVGPGSGRTSAARDFARHALGSLLGLFLALGAKEDGLAFGLLYAVLGLRRSRAALFGSLLGSVLAVAACLALRDLAFGSPWPSAPGAPLRGLALLPRLAVGGLALVHALALLAWPASASPLVDAQGLCKGLALGRSALALLAWSTLLACLVLALRRLLRLRARALAAGGLVLAAFAYLAWSQIVPAGEVFAPRFLYLPLLFATPLLATIWEALPRCHAKTGTLLAVLLLGATLAWRNSSTYADRASYWQRVLALEGESAVVWNALGTSQVDAGDRTAASRSFQRALQLDPGYSRPWTNLGLLAQREGESLRAEELWIIASRVGPENPLPRYHLAELCAASGRDTEAVEHYRAALALSPGLRVAREGLARALRRLGRAQEAEGSQRE